MGYFVSGWPKTYVLPTSSSSTPSTPSPPVISLVPSPTDRYLLTISSTALHIWSATQHRALLAQFKITTETHIKEGPFTTAVWSPDARHIIAGLRNGLVLIFAINPLPLEILTFQTIPEQPLVQPGPLPPLSLSISSEHRLAPGIQTLTAITPTPAGALLATSTSALACLSWSGEILWRVSLPDLLSANSALQKIGLDLSNPSEKAFLHAINHPDNALAGITALSYDRALGFVAVIFGVGAALLLGLHSGGHTRPSAIDGRWLRADSAVSIALEPRRMLATVGLADGDVEQYYVGIPAGDRCPVMRRLTLSSWYFEPDDVGSAVVVQWTSDGAALVVGWEKRGLAVWSVSGCRLMWTLPSVGGTLPTTPGNVRKGRAGGMVSPMETGVQAAAWGPNGLFLWAVPRCENGGEVDKRSEGARDCQFMEFSFYKGCGGSAVSQGESSRLAMFGSDRVLLLWHAEGGGGCSSQRSGTAWNDLFSWQHLLIPHDYMWRNWPPTRIAVNADATHVAVAGEYGIAICHAKTQKWRVFGDLEHDRRIRCCALAWVGRTIVIGNEVNSGRTNTPSFELLFYPREQVESTALQAHRKLHSRPILTDVRADGYLLVICEDAQVFLFQMREIYGRTRIELREIYRLLLPTRELTPLYQQDKPTKSFSHARLDADGESPPAPGGGISEARIFPPLSQSPGKSAAKAPPPTHIMLLRSTGSLILLDTERMLSTALLRYVERFWYTPVDCTPFDMISHRPVWWAYGDDGLHVSFQDDMPSLYSSDEDPDAFDPTLSPSIRQTAGRRKPVQVEQWFELDPEVYPLSIMSNYGMLLGATQGLEMHSLDSEASSMPRHVIQVKRQPILHTLLRHLLMKPMSDERTALQVALKCVSQPQFADSLEWLLYEAVLEHDDDVNVSVNGKSIQDANDARGMHPTRMYGSGGQNLTSGKGFPESPKRKKAGSDLFPRVIRLLKYFGEYEDIVVRCARKLDSKRWPLLFSFAGEPAALLEQCFVSGRLRTAACLLVILQEMWGFISSTPHSLRLVEAALARGELSLAADLANFLTKADRAGMLNSSQLRTTEDVSWIAEAALAPRGSTLSRLPRRKERNDESSDRIPAVDLAVLNHARFLLNKMDLRNLAALAVRMDFPLAEWLKRELKGKNASKPFVRDFGTTILSLHRQFQYPEPDHRDVRRAMRVFNHEVDLAKGRGSLLGHENHISATANGLERGASVDELLPVMTPRSVAQNATVQLIGPGAETVFGSQLPPPPTSYDSDVLVGIRSKARQLCHEELSFLMAVARVARAPDIILCCGTLLLDISVLKMVLRGHEDLFEPYVAALNEFNVSGYDALVAVLNEIAAPR